jgi:hypothetical protein
MAWLKQVLVAAADVYFRWRAVKRGEEARQEASEPGISEQDEIELRKSDAQPRLSAKAQKALALAPYTDPWGD